MSKNPPRPLILFALILIFSSYAVLGASEKYKLLVAILLTAVGVVFLCLIRIKKSIFLILGLSFIIGGLLPYSHYYFSEYEANKILSKNQNDALYSGSVASCTQRNGNSELILKIESIDGKALKHPQKAVFFAFGAIDAAENYLFNASGLLEEVSNYSDFDNVTYRKSDKVFLTLSSDDDIAFTPRKPSIAARLRIYISSVIRKFVGSRIYADSEIARALITGDKSSVPKPILDSFRSCGITHIICVSGLHISVILSFCFILFKRLHMPTVAIYLLVMTVGIMYMIIASFSPSVCRAVIMSLIYYLAFFFERNSDPLNSLALAAAALCMISPYNIYDIGAQLSFMATLGIISASYLNKAVAEKLKKIWILRDIASIVIATVFAVAFTLPISCIAYGSLSLVCIIANLAISFPITICLSLLLLLILLSPLGIIERFLFFIGFIIRLLIDFICILAQSLSSLPFSELPTEESAVTLIIFAVLVIFICVYLSYSKKPTALHITIPIFVLFGCILIKSFISYQSYYKANEINYMRTYYEEAISVKARGNSYLFISLNNKSISAPSEKAMFDRHTGKNYYLPVTLSKYGVDAVISAIEAFEENNDIKYLCLLDGSQLHKKLLAYYKGKTEIPFRILSIGRDFSFSDVQITAECTDIYELFTFYTDNKSVGLLKSEAFSDAFCNNKSFDAFVYSPIKNKRKAPVISSLDTENLFSAWYSDEEASGVVNLRREKFKTLLSCKSVSQ